jgi:ribonuclease HII
MTVGIDEVGRGCWAGPLVAAAVALSVPIEGLNDSKKLTKKRREILSQQIHKLADSVGIGWVTPAEVDELGLTKAVQLAMLRAMKQIDCDYDEIIIDGSYNFFANVTGLKTANLSAVIKADGTVPAVSAASIVAKVARDAKMVELAAAYPGYGFASHVGYGTAEHIAALKKLGVTDIHRTSYKPIKAYLL